MKKMTDQTRDSLIWTMAEMLVEKQVDTTIIYKSLELICTAFSFDGALVYEADQAHDFNLMERYLLHDFPLRESFAIDSIAPEFRSLMAESIITSIDKNEHNTTGESQLLKTLSATHATVFSVVDENARIFGLVIFLKTGSNTMLSDEDAKRLSVLLAMLGRYIGIRVYQNKISFARNSLESILDNTGIDIYVNDFHTHKVLWVNKSMAAPYGGPSAFVGKLCWQVLFPGQTGPCEFCPQKNLLDENGNPSKVYIWDYQRPFDGSWFRVFSAAFRWVDGRLAHVVSSADITDNKRNEELIQYLANFDSLTGLPNRRKLINDCTILIDHIQNRGNGYLLFFDLDGFKAINDNYGHDSGDEFLVKLGEFFLGIPMLKNRMYRHGGDEFVALIDGSVTKENIRSLVNFIHERFKKPWPLKKGNVFCNTSVGVASYPEDGDTSEELIRKADHAMYEIKKKGGAGICFYEEIEAGSVEPAKNPMLLQKS